MLQISWLLFSSVAISKPYNFYYDIAFIPCKTKQMTRPSHWNRQRTTHWKTLTGWHIPGTETYILKILTTRHTHTAKRQTPSQSHGEGQKDWQTLFTESHSETHTLFFIKISQFSPRLKYSWFWSTFSKIFIPQMYDFGWSIAVLYKVTMLKFRLLHILKDFKPLLSLNVLKICLIKKEY